jgi:hypothetical protein
MEDGESGITGEGEDTVGEDVIIPQPYPGDLNASLSSV